jgi:thymidylate synthase
VRRTAWKNALREMEWFLSGSNNINDLHEKVRHWWEPWANNAGHINNNYSIQLKSFVGRDTVVDQVKYMIDTLINHPNSRRNVITTWNTADMTSMITPITNCHGTVIQAFVEPGDKLCLTMYQRSADIVLGVPHNWIQYWAFMQYLCYQTGLRLGNLTWLGGDCHIYQDHYEMANKIIDHEDVTDIPHLEYNPSGDIFKAEDFSLDGKYKPLINENLKMTV